MPDIKVLGISPSTYLGQYPVMFVCINAAITGWYYGWTLVRDRNVVVSVTLGPVES